MTHSRLAVLASVLCLSAAAWPARALAIGFGVEGGAAVTYANTPASASGVVSNAAGSANLGLMVENTFNIAVVFLDLWADVQTPLRLQTGGADAAKYVPIDLGLRLGLTLGPIQPYAGILGQLAINTDAGGGPALSSPIFGIGGDVGLDIALFIFRFGVELRGVETVSNLYESSSIRADNGGSAFELEGLASVRLSF